jgi:carboxymethylenebutenolidase
MTIQRVVTQAMIDLYDEFTHRTLDRRGFMRDLSRLAGGSAAAAAIVPLLQASAAAAAIVAPDDARVAAREVTVAGPAGPVSGYLVQPSDRSGKLPAVIVIHENRGLNAHIRDVARRVALEGFAALAPDLLSPAGGTPADEDKAREMIGSLDRQATIDSLVAIAGWLRGKDEATGHVGCIGFCWGGGMAGALAVADPKLEAAIVYYGMQPPAGQVGKIKARLMLHYAGLDERINAGIPDFEAALKQAGVDYRLYVYAGANHAFNNDTAVARYDKAVADLAWSRSMGFLHEVLG